MSKLPDSTGKDVVAALERFGFSVIRTRSHHHSMRRPDGRTRVVPVRAGETIGPGLLSKILRDCDPTREEFASLS